MSSNDPKINYVNESSNSQCILGATFFFSKTESQKGNKNKIKKEGRKKKKKNKDKTNFFLKTPPQSYF